MNEHRKYQYKKKQLIRNTREKQLKQLMDQHRFITAIFIIPACYLFYYLTIDVLNFIYWTLLDQANLGFSTNPIINPMVKITTVIVIAILGFFAYYLNDNKKNEHAICIVQMLFLTTGITALSSIYSTASTTPEKLYNAKSLFYFMISQSNIWTVFIICIGILSFFYYYLYKTKKKIQDFNAFLFMGCCTFSILGFGVFYVIHSYLDMHISIGTHKYYQTQNYIKVQGYPNDDIYLIYCDSKCFGYLITDNNEKKYTYKTQPIIFQPENIIFIEPKKNEQ